MRVHSSMWIERNEGETQVDLSATFRRGYPASRSWAYPMGEPGEADGVEDIEAADFVTGKPVELTEAEEERAIELLLDAAEESARYGED